MEISTVLAYSALAGILILLAIGIGYRVKSGGEKLTVKQDKKLNLIIKLVVSALLVIFVVAVILRFMGL